MEFGKVIRRKRRALGCRKSEENGALYTTLLRPLPSVEQVACVRFGTIVAKVGGLFGP